MQDQQAYAAASQAAQPAQAPQGAPQPHPAQTAAYAAPPYHTAQTPPPPGAYATGPSIPPQSPHQYPVGSKEWEDAYVEREMRNAVGDINDGGHRKGAWSSFPYPILCVIVFLLAGFFWGIWHPAWIVFLTIPIYYYIAHVIESDPNYRK